MVLLAVLGLLMVVGVVLTIAWGSRCYRPWAEVRGSSTGEAREPHDGAPAAPAHPTELDAPILPVREAIHRYVRGLAIALVAGFWSGFLFTGSAMRLIMRLLGATSGESARGSVTEADQIVGDIDFNETLGLHIFGGILPGLLSGGLYLLVRRWLPAGRLGGVAFGALHLIIAATRLDPLRPENPDFDLLGPGWLSVLTFGLATVVHGMAVAAFANRFSASFPSPERGVPPLPVLLVLAPAILILIPGAALMVPVLAGLALSVAAGRTRGLAPLLASRPILVGGRIALGLLALVFFPGMIDDLHDIIVRPPEN